MIFREEPLREFSGMEPKKLTDFFADFFRGK